MTIRDHKTDREKLIELAEMVVAFQCSSKNCTNLKIKAMEILKELDDGNPPAKK